MYLDEYKRWLAAELDDADLKPELAKIEGNDDEIKDRFAVALKFGTAGLRGVLGAGTNRMNIYVVRQATQGLANWVKTQGGSQTVAISYDSRIKSDVFAKTAAEAEKLPVPYLGVVDAAAREAAFSTRNRRIGVIGTAATIRSRSYEALLRRLVPGVEITARPCPLFVPLVEAGYVDHSAPDKQEITKLVIAQYLTEIRDAGVDTLILGCTHYPLIKTMIGEFMGRNVVLVDPAKTAAHHLERILSERGLKADHPAGQAHFYVSDAPDGFVQTADLFLGEYKGGEVEQIAIDKY